MLVEELLKTLKPQRRIPKKLLREDFILGLIMAEKAHARWGTVEIWDEYGIPELDNEQAKRLLETLGQPVSRAYNGGLPF